MFKRVLSYLKDTTAYEYRLNAVCNQIPDIIDTSTALEYITCYRDNYLPKEDIEVLTAFVLEGINIGRIPSSYLTLVQGMKEMDANRLPDHDPLSILNTINLARRVA